MGKTILRYEDIPDRAFIKVLMKRDIIKARIISVNEKKDLPRGSADIMIKSPVCESKLIYRKDILKMYRHLNGSNVKLRYWRNCRDYTLMGNVEIPAFAMLIPKKFGVNLRGNNIMPRKCKEYLVCLCDSNGNIDRGTVRVVTSMLFKKMFTVPPNDVIIRHIGSYKSSDVVLKHSIGQEKFKGQSNETSNKPSLFDGATNINNKNLNYTKSMKADTKTNDTKLTAVGVLLNSDNKTVGFILSDSKGETRNSSKLEVTQLCSKKLIDNIVMATREKDGKRYLRGNGIKLDTLPKKYV